jgi:hypothetical protein
MGVVFTHDAGLDVHKKTAMICRVIPDPIGQQAHGLMGVQEFGTLPCDLQALSNLLVEGQADTPVMAELAQGWLRSKIPGSEQALTGLVRGHYPELLARQLAHIDFLDEHNDTLSVATTPCLLDLAAGEPPMAPMAMAGMAEGGAAPNLSPLLCWTLPRRCACWVLFPLLGEFPTAPLRERTPELIRSLAGQLDQMHRHRGGKRPASDHGQAYQTALPGSG